MRIRFRPTEGKARSAREPYRDCGYVVVDGQCPVCTGKKVLVAHDIRETTIFGEGDRQRAEQHLRDRGAQEWEELEPSTEWKLVGTHRQVGEYDAAARAVCFRCRSHVGELYVKFNTIFGRTEDMNVLSGRYGIIIAPE